MLDWVDLPSLIVQDLDRGGFHGPLRFTSDRLEPRAETHRLIFGWLALDRRAEP